MQLFPLVLTRCQLWYEQSTNILRLYSVLEIFPEENSSISQASILTPSSVFVCLFIFRLLADYAQEVAFKEHESFYLVIIIDRGV